MAFTIDIDLHSSNRSVQNINWLLIIIRKAASLNQISEPKRKVSRKNVPEEKERERERERERDPLLSQGAP